MFGIAPGQGSALRGQLQDKEAWLPPEQLPSGQPFPKKTCTFLCKIKTVENGICPPS